MADIEPFVVQVDDAVVDGLRERLVRMRWPRDLANEDWGYGTNLEYLRELVDHWVHRDGIGPLPTAAPVVVAMARDTGGHFGPAEEPAAFVDDVRATFRSIR